MHKYILILLALFLVGCSPKYVVKKQYIAPKDKSFAGCVKTCEIEKKVCDQDCKNQYDTCLNNAYSRSKDISNIEFVKYNEYYEEYLLKLRDYKSYRYRFDKNYLMIKDDYKYFHKQCVKTKEYYACHRKTELKNKMIKMRHNRMVHPQEPLKPSFQAILKDQQSFCKSDCGCSDSFDRCYINCGGEIVPYKFCVKNCD